MHLDQPHLEYLESHRLGQLATLGPSGKPQNKPVGYRYNRALGTIDIGGFNMGTSAKYLNIARNPEVSFVVDDAIGEGRSGVRFIEVRGSAEQSATEPAGVGGGGGSPIIRIRPRRVVSWNLGEGPASFQSFDSEPEPDRGLAGDRPRPALGAPVSEEAASAVTRLVAELQQGLDERDADASNRHFAADVVWGSPYGATVAGYDELHAIHTRLKQQGVAGPSRFEIVQILAPTPGVVVVHVRRAALDETGRPVEPSADPSAPFSEMAMYVLVRRHGEWWLAAGQNTPIRPAPTP